MKNAATVDEACDGKIVKFSTLFPLINLLIFLLNTQGSPAEPYIWMS